MTTVIVLGFVILLLLGGIVWVSIGLPVEAAPFGGLGAFYFLGSLIAGAIWNDMFGDYLFFGGPPEFIGLSVHCGIGAAIVVLAIRFAPAVATAPGLIATLLSITADILSIISFIESHIR